MMVVPERSIRNPGDGVPGQLDTIRMCPTCRTEQNKAHYFGKSRLLRNQ